MTVSKILIVTDDAGESYEILYAKHRFEEEGWTAHIGATKKKRLNGVIHDFEADVALGQAKATSYDAVLLIDYFSGEIVGGRGLNHLHTSLALPLALPYAAADAATW